MRDVYDRRVGFVSLFLMFAAVATTRYYVARSFGIRDLRLFFRSGPETRLEGISSWARPTIVVACFAAAYLLAVVPFSAGALLGGETSYGGTTVDVVPGAPAAEAGMKSGDTVLAVAGAKVDTFDALRDAVHSHAGERVEVAVERAGAQVHLDVTPRPAGTPLEGTIGVRAIAFHRDVSMAEAIPFGIAAPPAALLALARGLPAYLLGRPAAEASGPLAIVAAPRRSTAERILYSLGTWNIYCGIALVLLTAVSLPRKRRVATPT